MRTWSRKNWAFWMEFWAREATTAQRYRFLAWASCDCICRIRNLRLGCRTFYFDYAILVLNNVAGLTTDAAYDFDTIENWWEEARGRMGCRGPYEPLPGAWSCTDLILASCVSYKHFSTLFSDDSFFLIISICWSASQVEKSSHSHVRIIWVHKLHYFAHLTAGSWYLHQH